VATPEIIPAFDVPLPELAALFSRAYAGYVAGRVEFDTLAFSRFLSQHGVDLWLSRLVRTEAGPVGFGYINRTGGVARLASLGVASEARRRGCARLLLTHLLQESRARAEREMYLEVIEQNPPAVALYRSLGFQERGRLLGWSRAADIPAPTPTPESGGAEPREITLLEAVQRPVAEDYPEVPWQVSRLAAAKLGPPARAFALGPARLVYSDPPTGPWRVHGLFVDPATAPATTPLRELLGALIRRHPGQAWVAPAIFPEGTGREVFGKLGFGLEPLNQFLMVRTP